jgi:predicted DsbA family dithiol-disulfide isomerase
MTSHPEPPFNIDVVSDVVCPWCYIGKRRLDAALAELAHRDPTVRPLVSWHPFQLDADVPATGLPRHAYMEAKFGGKARLKEAHDRLRAAGATVGITFAFEAILRQPNTLDAHRLIGWAQRQGDAGPLVEALFKAFFVDGRDIGDRATLAAVAGEAGQDAAAAATMLASGEGSDGVAELCRRSRELGIEGVPFFIFGDQFAVSGAQPPEVLLDGIAQARAAVPDA